VVLPETPAPESEEDEPQVDMQSSGSLPPSPVAEKTAPQARAARSARVAVTPRKAQDGLPDVAPVIPTPTVANEARLIHEALVALQSEQPARALALFDAHALLYPHGVLAEEREAERALALAELGRTAEAREAIEQFLRLHPASPLAPRLRERERLLDHAGP
jgi:Flp pilus assembly protein TadD